MACMLLSLTHEYSDYPEYKESSESLMYAYRTAVVAEKSLLCSLCVEGAPLRSPLPSDFQLWNPNSTLCMYELQQHQIQSKQKDLSVLF